MDGRPPQEILGFGGGSAGPAARSEGPKHELLARLKAANTRRALFFFTRVRVSACH
jgi:hypothetical protein